MALVCASPSGLQVPADTWASPRVLLRLLGTVLVSTYLLYWAALAPFTGLMLWALVPLALTAMLAIALPLWLFASMLGRAYARLTVVMMFLVAAGPAAVAGNESLGWVEHHVAERHALQIAAAVEAHIKQEGEIPSELDQLVPAYLDSVPRYPDFRIPGGVPYNLTGDASSFGLVVYRGWYSGYWSPDGGGWVLLD